VVTAAYRCVPMGPASGKVNSTQFAMVGSGSGGGRGVEWDDARRWAPGCVKVHAVSHLFDSLDIFVVLCVLAKHRFRCFFFLVSPLEASSKIPAPNANWENLVGE